MAARASGRQLPLDLAPAPSYARDAFLPADCNRRALAHVLNWSAWPGGRLILTGPEASGKTHLAHIWAAEAHAALADADHLDEADIAALTGRGIAIEAADRIAGQPQRERALLHLLNAAHEAGAPLLLTARARPGHWGLALPDLSSRISAAPHARLEAPDDALLAAVLLKLFGDRQLEVSPRLIAWLVRRMDRSLAAANDIVAQLDEAALSAGGPVTREMAARILDNP